jgi:hypothetical protein
MDWNRLEWTGIDIFLISWEFRGTIVLDNQRVTKKFGKNLGKSTSRGKNLAKLYLIIKELQENLGTSWEKLF